MARAIWKGVIRFGKAELPVKLYPAVQDLSVHFRLLHEKDLVPVKQQMVNPESGEVVPPDQIRKAYRVSRTALVVLDDEDLEKLQPEPSRDIEITRFVDPEDIDHRWYERAYYLGPDAGQGDYFALAEALARRNKEGVARWVMRDRNYVGALRAEEGYLMLIVLRHAEEVISSEQLEPPRGRALDRREVSMAEQLVEALSDKFDPSEFRDEYRERVMELVETKSRGGKVKVKKFRPRAVEEETLDEALEASLQSVGKKRAAGGRG